MTISTETASIAIEGDGASRAFSFPFPILQPGDLTVYRRLTTGEISLAQLGQHYELEGEGSPFGGTITFDEEHVPQSGEVITLVRTMAVTQPADFDVDTEFASQRIEQALDHSRMIDQQLADQLARSLHFPAGDAPGADSYSEEVTTPVGTLPSIAERRDRFLVFDPLSGAPRASSLTQSEFAALETAFDINVETLTAIADEVEAKRQDVHETAADFVPLNYDTIRSANQRSLPDDNLYFPVANTGTGTVEQVRISELGFDSGLRNLYLPEHADTIVVVNSEDAHTVHWNESYDNVGNSGHVVFDLHYLDFYKPYHFANGAAETCALDPGPGCKFAGLSSLDEVLLMGPGDFVTIRRTGAGTYFIAAAHSYPDAAQADHGAVTTIKRWYQEADGKWRLIGVWSILPHGSGDNPANASLIELPDGFSQATPYDHLSNVEGFYVTAIEPYFLVDDDAPSHITPAEYEPIRVMGNTPDNPTPAGKVQFYNPNTKIVRAVVEIANLQMDEES